ncbi:condensin complex subunit 3-like [Mytilus edulis]|uniref:condensin complex subunit 3-like n=1 Tax=Mytilus edulis TaxID=6550 RepID=UPI0039F1046C
MKQPTMKEVFEQCQNSMKSHSNLLKYMEKLYDKTEFSKFWSDFNHYLKYPMIVFQREPVVERTIDFIAKFVTSVNPDPEVPGTDKDDSLLDEVSQNRLLLNMFEFLLKSHNVNSRAVRFRCCQLINKILNNLGDDAQIDDDLYDKIYQCMLERLRDKEPVVRFHAVMALARLQDPKDENCPVIKAYLFLIQSDPNPEVRRAVMSCIAPSPKTLPAILEKTRDVKDTVRKTAYNVLGEKVHIKALSIANRERLLQEGLTDRVESVKEACSSKLLQAWLRTFGGNVLELLGALDVEYATGTCELVLNTLFKHTSTAELIKNFDILNEKVLIPQEKLNAESVMYWNMLCKHIHGLGTDFDADLEKVLPNCLEFSNYIKEYVDTLKGCDDIDIQLQKQFVIQQLLAITVYMDLADTVSRKAMENLLSSMLTADHVAFNLVKFIIPRLCEIKDYSDSLVNQMAVTISDIREPITTVEKDVNEEMRRQNDLKIAGIRVKINQLKEDMDESIRSQDFSKAAEIKESIKGLDEERDKVLKDNEPQTEEVKSEKTDVATLLKCQAIVAEMLEALPLKTLNPTLQTLIETLILPGIMNEDAGIRNMAVRSLGMCCLLNKDLVLVHLPLFMQASQIDVECVRVTSLKVMIDLLHMHGTEAIKHAGKKPTEEQLNTSCDLYEEPTDNSEQASKLVAFLTAFLDSQNSELRTIAAEGMSKLMLSGRVVSSKILSHLLLLWYNPVTEDDTHLRHCLGTFLPIFAFAGRSNQEMIEEAFLPTLKTIVSAPLSSPLAEVNPDNVAELLVQLTNSKLLLENQKSEEQTTENPGHDNLAITICNEILSNPEANTLKVFVKVLNQLEFSPNNVVNLKEIAVLTEKISKVIKDNPCLKTVEKIKAYVNSLLPEESPSMEEDNNTDEQTEALEEKGDGDANTTVDRSALNDTAQQLEGSLFQESRTLKRIKSITSTKSLDASELEADIRELPVFPEIQEEPDTPRLIGIKTPSKSVKRTPAKGATPLKGQTTKTMKPSKLTDVESRNAASSEDNHDTETVSSGNETEKSTLRGRTPTKRKTKDDEESPIQIKSPKSSSSKKSPARKESPSKSPARADKSPRGRTPTKRKTTTEEHSPVHRKSSKKSSPARVEKSPARGKTPTKRKAATEEKHLQGKSPKKPAPAKKSPSKTESIGKSRTATRGQKTTERVQTPTKGKSPVRGKSAKSPSRSETPSKGTPQKGKSPTRKETATKVNSPRTMTPIKSKPNTRTGTPTTATPPVKRATRGKSPKTITPTKGQPSATDTTPVAKKIQSKEKPSESPASVRSRRVVDQKKDAAKPVSSLAKKSPSPVKNTGRSTRGKASSILSDDELSTSSSVKSPRVNKKDASSEDEDDIPSTDSSVISVTRSTRCNRNVSGDTSTKSPVTSVTRNIRRAKKMAGDDDLPSTDSTLKSSPRNTRKKVPAKGTRTKAKNTPSVSDDEDTMSTDSSIKRPVRGTRKTLISDSEESVKSSSRSTRRKPVDTSDDDSVKSTASSRRSAASKITDDDTDSSIVSSTRNTRKKGSIKKPSITLQELAADSDSESGSPAKVSHHRIKSSRKMTKDLETVLDESDMDTVFESPSRGTRSAVKPTKKATEEVTNEKKGKSTRSKQDSKAPEINQPRSRRTLRSKQSD